MSTSTTINKGEIRHPKRTPEALMKVIGPYDSEIYNSDGASPQEIKLFILTRDFPNHHYVVVLDIVESATAKGEHFCVAHLITHSTNFDNLKVTSELYDPLTTSISLTDSYVTRDKFLINVNDIDKSKSYGQFNLDKLKDAIEY